MDQIEFSMDSYYPAVTTPRPPHLYQPAIHLQDLLQFANSIAIHCEDNDPQICGERTIPVLQVGSTDPQDLESDELAESESSLSPSPTPTLPTLECIPPRLITYAHRDREWAAAERVAVVAFAAHCRAVSLLALERRLSSPWQSPCLQHPAPEQSAEELRQDSGHVLYSLIKGLSRPLVDQLDYVMLVVADGPNHNREWWAGITQRPTREIARVARQSRPGADSMLDSIHFGMGFSTEDHRPFALPHTMVHHAVDPDEMISLVKNQSLHTISAYQNRYAAAAAKTGKVEGRCFAPIPFTDTVFMTCEIIFHNTSLSRVNYETAFKTMEAITALGAYDHTKGGHVISWDDHAMIELPLVPPS
ncbi:hypothetical protein DFH08DRAFT_960675 [Mycena albidolilacea]|uniref:Uncharacterized protein n=1 Tax=Mycena albidolilacea TaxID=1033008 RepID=A0AAD7ESQ3_9AGAR|nr:hypothetical protein DFH08DRAFT_960675 [Mycena albidolilacea]